MINPQEGEDAMMHELAQNYQASVISDDYDNQSLSSYFSRQYVSKKKTNSRRGSFKSVRNENVISIENIESPREPLKVKKDEFDPFQTTE